MLNLFVTILAGSHHLDTPLTSIYFFAIVIGLTLPWQLNTKGQIELGYCRYHLSMPVRTWQLYIIPLICRLCLIVFFVMIEVMLYWIFYQRVKSLDIVRVIKIAVLIYLVLQAYSWSKISFKNLFFYLGVMFAACVLLWPVLFRYIMGCPVYFVLVSGFTILAVMGVRYLRFSRRRHVRRRHNDAHRHRRRLLAGAAQLAAPDNLAGTDFQTGWKSFVMPTAAI